MAVLCLFIASTVNAGSYDDPEIEDPEGDTEVPGLDITHVWIEHRSFDVAQITMLLAGPVPAAPDLATGGMFTGPYYHVDFDLVDWNGTRIGDIEDQYVALAVEEAIVFVYVCVWEHPEWGGCWSDGFGRINQFSIQWEVDIKGPNGDNRTVGSGYRFENLSARTELRALAQPIPGDRAPDSGSAESVSEPTAYTNVHTPSSDPEVAAPIERGFIAIGIAVFTGVLVGAGRVVYKIGRFRLFQWLLLHFLFSRIQRNEVLSHKRRAAIFEAVKQNPGKTFGELRRELRVGSGSLAFHLKVLEQQGLLAYVRDGRRSRFYVRGPKPEFQDYLGHTQRCVLEAVQGHPGASPTHLAALVGLPRHAVQYHLGRLLEKGRVRRRRDGRHARYYA